MERQLIISIGREFGSGGHVVAEELAKRFGLPLYNTNILAEIAEHRKVDEKELAKFDEVPRSRLFARKVRGHSNSPSENLANLQFDYMKKMAEEGKSFVIVGRCAESVLKGNPALIPIFILADYDAKKLRVMRKLNLSAEDAKQRMRIEDFRRKSYHNYYCDVKWGDSRNYEICINSSTLGLEKTADLLEAYIRQRISGEKSEI